MGFFDKAKETFRDKTRDKVYAGLQTLGVDARMAERGRPEEHVGEDFGKSLGLMEIRGSPIRWVNVLKETEGGGPTSTVNYTIAFLVPNPTIQREVHLKTIREKSVPVVGRVVDLQWQGNFEEGFNGLMIEKAIRNQSLTRLREMVRWLNEDVSLNENLIRLNADVHIRGYPKYDYWAILHISGSFEWDCLETIARHLLEPAESESTGTAD